MSSCGKMSQLHNMQAITQKGTSYCLDILTENTLTLSSCLSRADETLLSQIRTGQHRSAGPLWRHLGPNRDRLCRWCKAANSVESIPHLLFDCTNVDIVRLRRVTPLLARYTPGQQVPIMGGKVTVKDLEKMVEFFRNSLRLLN